LFGQAIHENFETASRRLDFVDQCAVFAFQPGNTIAQRLIFCPQHLAKREHLLDLLFEAIESVIHTDSLLEKGFPVK
jgi:hypothetical protein